MNPLKQTFKEIDSQDLSNIRLLGEHLLIRIYPKKEQTEGGLVMPERSQEHRCVAWVLAVGKDVDPEIKVGDTIMCPFSNLRNTITELDDDGQVCYLLEHDVVVHYPQASK